MSLAGLPGAIRAALSDLTHRAKYGNATWNRGAAHVCSNDFLKGVVGVQYLVVTGVLPSSPRLRRDKWYFWENNYERALLRAHEKCKKSGKKPDVIGAVIIPGECLDLTDSAYLRALEQISSNFEEYYQIKHGKPVPQNDLSRNYHAYDCSLINFFRETMQQANGRRFNTVRAAFNEGSNTAGSSFATLNHIQWAVLTPSESIIGYFRPTKFHIRQRNS